LGDYIGRIQLTQLPLVGVVSASIGASDSLFVLKDSSVFGAGANLNGQLGLGDTFSHITMKFVANGVSKVSVGQSHSLFLFLNGTVYSCGLNAVGHM
jgi:alpha-tubulin suppressor-like RCC1 family protein